MSQMVSMLSDSNAMRLNQVKPNMISVENPFSGELVLLDFDQSNLRRGYDGSADIALVCGLNFQVGCQDRLRVNSAADEALA